MTDDEEWLAGNCIKMQKTIDKQEKLLYYIYKELKKRHKGKTRPRTFMQKNNRKNFE